MFEKTDQQLIDKAIQGHRQSWMALFKRFEKPLYNYALRMTGNPDDAMDLMQDIFMSVHRNLATYRGEGSFKGWLFRIAHYRCVEFYRRRKPTQGLDDVPEPEAQNACIEGNSSMAQEQQRMLGSLQQLPINQRAVVELKFFGQFTFDEIAAQLGISANTVKSRLYAALDKMKGLLEVESV